MNKRELVAAIAAHTESDTKTVARIVDGFVEVTQATLSKGDPVVLSGFAKFAKVKRAARMGRNPQTGEPVKIKASVKARITPLKGLKDVVAGNTPAPKLVKAAVVKKAAPAKKAAAVKKAPAKKAAVAKKAAPAKKAPAKKATARR
ncbi:MAG: DNA-binding protein HU-beta [Acidimicrobiia bacterium]|nr:DNA-binding protein HU-beta [Acidimicrobiia bacterium]